MITLNLQSRLPIYEQLKNQISQLILTGNLKGDEQLPSVRNFARELGINPNTVQKAYQELEREGLIYSVTGKGNFISPNPNIIKQLLDDHRAKFEVSARISIKAGVPEQDLINIVGKVSHEEGK